MAGVAPAKCVDTIEGDQISTSVLTGDYRVLSVRFFNLVPKKPRLETLAVLGGPDDNKGAAAYSSQKQGCKSPTSSPDAPSQRTRQPAMNRSK